MDVATASVGLTIAPTAIPVARSTPGTTWSRKTPMTTALTTTSTTDRLLIARRSRRKSMAGNETAAEYSSGGRTPIRIHSGSISTAGTNGRRLTPTPITTSSSGAATPSRDANAVTPAMHSTAVTPRRATSMEPEYAATSRRGLRP